MTMRSAIAIGAIITLSQLTSGCYFFDFFTKKASDGTEANDGVIGQPLGAKAGSRDDSALASVYAITTSVAPAAIRPDPDTMVRRLIRQYRSEGAVVARQIGKSEEYRMLLGGASADFSTAPQESYDATSVLATLKVAEEVCESLVAPNSSDHPGWTTILPAAASDSDTNTRFIAQRFTGLPGSKISDEAITSLKEILTKAAAGSEITYDHYVPVCVAAALDANALFF